MRVLQKILSTIGSIPGISSSAGSASASSEREASFYSIEKRTMSRLRKQPELPDNLNIKTTESMKDTKVIIHESREVEAQKAKAALQKILAAEEEKNNELCAIWEAKLKAIPWFDGNLQNIPGLLQHKQHFLQAKELMTEFENIYFPVRICNSLERIARDLQTRIIIFPFNFNKTAKILAEEVTLSIEKRIEFLTRNKGLINDPNQKPSIIDNNKLIEFTCQTDELKPLFDEDPMQMEPLLNALNQFKELITKPVIF